MEDKEACTIVITQNPINNEVQVNAPMKYKELCYDILTDAKKVIDKTGTEYFRPNQLQLVIRMTMAGRVDVIAPLPIQERCHILLKAARHIIEQFEYAT